MWREPLSAIRSRIKQLATTDGEYVVVCGRTGQQPVPVDGLAFPDRATAAEAAQTAMTYRALIRDYDPQAPLYDFIACQRDASTQERPTALASSVSTPGRKMCDRRDTPPPSA